MGLTIHYQGQLRSEAAYLAFISKVRQFAATHGWQTYPIVESSRQLVRTLQPEDPSAEEIEEMYEGPTRGLHVLPHPDCEPLNLEFDSDLFMQDWCKTQFAGASTHAAIVHLFRSTEELFEMLDIHDEAEFWEATDTTESRAKLEGVFNRTRQEIDSAAAEDTGASVGVLTPSGRILDVLVE